MLGSVTKSEKDFGLLVYASSLLGYVVPLGVLAQT